MAAALVSGPAGAAADPVTVRIGYASIGVGNRPFVGGTSAAIAHSQHYVEKEFEGNPNVKIEWSFFRGAGPAVNEALANHQLDFALQGDLPSLIHRGNGLKTRLLLASGAHTPTYIAVKAGSDIARVEDLKGRKVSLFRGTNLELAIVKALAAHGLKESDLKLLNMDFATSSAALANGDIDAAIGANELFEFQAKGLAKIIYATKGDNPAFGRHAHLLVTEEFEQGHPDLTQTVVNAVVKAAKWASEETNRQALAEAYALSGIPVSTFLADLEGDDLNYRNSPLFDPFLVEQYKVQARQAREHGLLRRDVEIESWIDARYLETALKTLHLETFWTRYGVDGKAARS
jgi:sulfonate transport system substrate-binding protein